MNLETVKEKWQETTFECRVLPLLVTVETTGKICSSLEEGLELFLGKENFPTLKCAKFGALVYVLLDSFFL